MRDEIRRCKPILIRRTPSRARRHINLRMQLRDLLSHSMMWPMQNRAAETHRAVGFQVVGGDGGEFDGHFYGVAHDDCVEDFVVVHYIQLVHTRDDLAVETENYIAFHESGGLVAAFESAFADHEELVTR
jgi:hypothetical protein